MHTIGRFQNMKTVVKNMSKWHKMTEKRKRKNNYGVNYFQSKIKTVFKIKKHSSKYLKKFIQSKNKES